MRLLFPLFVAMLTLAACSRPESPAAKTPNAPAEVTKPAELPTDAAAIIEMFRSRGLPIGEVVVFTGDNDPNELLGRPNQYTGKATFLDSRLHREQTDKIDVRDGGTVEVFASAADAKARHDYTSAISKSASMFAEYGLMEGRTVLRLSKRITPEQAAQYEALLKNPAAQVTPLPAVAQQGAPTPFVVATTAPPPPAALAPPSGTLERVRVTGAGAEGVNLRADPSTTAARVKTLTDGTVLEVIGPSQMGEGRAWRNVRDTTDGATGWMAAEFVGPADTSPAPAPAPAAPTPAPKPAAPSKPAPGSAIVCNDGSTWRSMVRQGACSGRGGIAPGY